MAQTNDKNAEHFSMTTSAKARERNCSEQTVRELADRGVLEHIRTSTGARLFKPESRTAK